ncbi:PC4 domain-containing protein [Trichonephila clavipes]|nr:PC4 domain-containing protein [Trichonephila clavipes]
MEGLNNHQCAQKIRALQTVLEVKREEFVDDALIYAKSLFEELETSFEPQRRIRRKNILGDEKSFPYAVVSDFACVARIHLRRYKLDATGSLLPTKDGITVTPSVWLALVREFAAIDQAFDDGKVFVIKDCLLLSRTVIENATYIICQSYFQRKDFSRKFLTPVSMLKETERNALKDIHKQITSKTVSIMFGRVFLKLLRKEVAKHIPFPKSDYDCIDAEIVLTTSYVTISKKIFHHCLVATDVWKDTKIN